VDLINSEQTTISWGERRRHAGIRLADIQTRKSSYAGSSEESMQSPIMIKHASGVGSGDRRWTSELNKHTGKADRQGDAGGEMGGDTGGEKSGWTHTAALITLGSYRRKSAF
jgi:hypothetical protein